MHDKYKKTGDPAVGSTRLVGRCRNCGGRKHNHKTWYCDACRVSMHIPKREWVLPHAQPTPELPASTARPSLCAAAGSELRCPFCGEPGEKLYQSAMPKWGDNSDNAAKGWRCGCFKCDRMFFIPNAKVSSGD